MKATFLSFLLSASSLFATDGVFYVDKPVEVHLIAQSGVTVTNHLSDGSTTMVGATTLTELCLSEKTTPGASPHTPGHDRRFPGMLFSLCTFRIQVSHQIQRYTSNLSSLREGYKPAPRGAVVVLSSPNVVSDALHRVRYVSRTWSAGAAWWSSTVVITVQVSDTSSVPSPEGRTALCSAARTGSRSCFFPDGAFSQVRRDPSGSQPPPGSSGSARVALTRATTCPPASRIALISS